MRSSSLATGNSARMVGLLLVALATSSACSREIGAESEERAPSLVPSLHAGEPRPASAPAVTDPEPGEAAPPAAGELSSVLYSEHDAEVATRVAGMVASVAAELGDRVRAGQLLATLSDEQEQAALEAARATLDLERLEHERASRLREQQLVTQAEVDQATYRVRAAGAALREAAVRLEYTRIRAPFAGAVTRRFVQVGQSVEAREPIVRVTALRPLRTRVRVPEVAAHALAQGQTLRLRGLTGERVEGRIHRIAPAVDPMSGTVELLVEVPEAGGLRPGSAVSVELPGAAAPRP